MLSARCACELLTWFLAPLTLTSLELGRFVKYNNLGSGATSRKSHRHTSLVTEWRAHLSFLLLLAVSLLWVTSPE